MRRPLEVSFNRRRSSGLQTEMGKVEQMARAGTDVVVEEQIMA